jgi:hypothetical protein
LHIFLLAFESYKIKKENLGGGVMQEENNSNRGKCCED